MIVLTPLSSTDRLVQTEITVTVSLASYQAATTADFTLNVEITCSDKSLTVPSNYGPFTHTALDPIKVATPSYAFSKNCDEALQYDYFIENSQLTEVTGTELDCIAHDAATLNFEIGDSLPSHADVYTVVVSGKFVSEAASLLSF